MPPWAPPLPRRRGTMAELTRRYIVMAMATEAPFDLTDVEGVFVLKPWKDPAALRALETYRDNCYPELARELDAWIAMARAGTRGLGGGGRRNPRAGPSGKGARSEEPTSEIPSQA